MLLLQILLIVNLLSIVKAGVSISDTIPYGNRTYSDCFVEALISEAERHKDIVAVHAGMGMEPSLHLLKDVFAEKFFDVGMAEQHAVTFAAGLACGGLKPFCIIPSAFLQRAYDQVSLSLSLSRSRAHTRRDRYRG